MKQSIDESIGVVVRAAQDLGIELDIEEAKEWITAVSAESTGGSLVVDVNTGVYGHRVIMKDHSADDLARFRHIAAVVGIDDRPPEVMTALALSGSAAQNQIHEFPADFDFFERVHIRAASKEDACNILADVIREKALARFTGPGYRLQEVKFGSWEIDGTIGDRDFHSGSPIEWSASQVDKGEIEYLTADGEPATLAWSDAA